MAHFDYGFRIHDLSITEFEIYEDKLKAIFKQCIKRNMAFELNSKSLYRYKKYDLYEWAIFLYQELGETLLSLGSDAHKDSEHMLGFKDSVRLLEKFKVGEVVLFRKEKSHFIKLADIKKTY